MALCRSGILCSRASFLPDQENVPIESRKTIGDASETAVLKSMETYFGNVTFNTRYFYCATSFVILRLRE